MTETAAAQRHSTFPLALLPLALLFACLMYAGVLVQPPAVRAENSVTQFNTTEARGRLARILGDQTPHPVDSEAQDVVRAALLTEIRALGFAPEVRDAFTCRPQPRGPLIDCARVRNIVFSIGPEAGPAILAASHYDSVPASPGASDDGIGIAAWLEVARILSQEDLARRVIFLISDGEEPALLGARDFALNDPLMASVESVVNLEARGSRGPAVFFESNQPNADAVAAFAPAPRGIANSVMADAYRLLPNSTDVTELTRPGLDVINIALLDGLEDYHTPQDSLASADPRSLQHMGDIALDVTRRLAGAPDHDVETPMVYTDVASRLFISMPSWAGQAILAVSALIAFAAFWRAGRDARWRTFVAPLVAIIVAGVTALAAGFLLGVLRPGENYAFAHPEPARAWCALFGLLGVVAAMMAMRVSRAPGHAAASAQFWFAALGLLLSVPLSGISILFALPALVFALGALVGLVWKPAQAIGAIASALVALIVWAPALYLTELALGFEYPFATSILVALLALTWVGVVVVSQRAVQWRGVAATLAVAAIAAVSVSVFTPAATASRPQPLNITYFRNLADNEARILAGNAHRALPPALRGAYEAEEILPGDLAPTWAASAALDDVPAPMLQDLAASDANGERVVTARIAMNGAYRIILRIPRSAEPLRASVNGVETSFADTGEGTDYLNVACQGRACDGAAITIVLAAERAVAGEGPPPGDWYVIGQTPGFSAPAVDTARGARPVTATPIQFGDAALSLVRIRPLEASPQ